MPSVLTQETSSWVVTHSEHPDFKSEALVAMEVVKRWAKTFASKRGLSAMPVAAPCSCEPSFGWHAIVFYSFLIGDAGSLTHAHLSLGSLPTNAHRS